MISHVHDFSFPTNGFLHLTIFAEGDFHTLVLYSVVLIAIDWGTWPSWYIDVTTSSISSQNFKLRLFQRFHILVHHMLHFTWNILFALVNNRLTTSPSADNIWFNQYKIAHSYEKHAFRFVGYDDSFYQ